MDPIRGAAAPCPVLVVDDDHGVRAALCNLLDSAGYGSRGFAAAEELLASACLAQATCAVVDLGLCGMGGIELAEHLARLRPGLPVILMSAEDCPAQRQRAMRLGAAALLLKPFDAETLLAHLHRLLPGRGCGTMQL